MHQLLDVRISTRQHGSIYALPPYSGGEQKDFTMKYDSLWMLDPTGAISLADTMAALEHCAYDALAAAEYIADCHIMGVAPSQRVATPEYR